MAEPLARMKSITNVPVAIVGPHARSDSSFSQQVASCGRPHAADHNLYIFSTSSDEVTMPRHTISSPSILT